MQPNEDAYKWLRKLGLGTAIVLSGTFLVAPHEGKVNKTYIDPVGIVTSCLGHTGKELRIGQKFSDEQCYAQMAEDLENSQRYVHLYVKVPLNVYQEAALISFTYNAGVAKLASSTMLRQFNAGDYKHGCEELLKWTYANHKQLPGLVSRRKDEEEMCLGNKDIVDFVKQEGLNR